MSNSDQPQHSVDNDASPLPEQESARADHSPTEPSHYQLPIPHWVFSLIGHVLAAATGLGLGYLILHWLYPAKFLLPW